LREKGGVVGMITLIITEWDCGVEWTDRVCAVEWVNWDWC
jgi:hypothetical protein